MEIIYPVEEFIGRLEEIAKRKKIRGRGLVHVGCIELWNLEAPEISRLHRALPRIDEREQIDLLFYLKTLLQCGEREEIQRVFGEAALRKIEAGIYGSKGRLMVSHLPRRELRVWYDKPTEISSSHVDSSGKGLLLDMRADYEESSGEYIEQLLERVINTMYLPSGHFMRDSGFTLKPLGEGDEFDSRGMYFERYHPFASLPVTAEKGRLCVEGMFYTFPMFYHKRERENEKNSHRR